MEVKITEKILEALHKFNTNNGNLEYKIQRIPLFLQEKDNFVKYCMPQMISFGPIHHSNETLKQEGEPYKYLWTSKYITEHAKKTNQDVNLALQSLLKKIEDNIEGLKKLFIEDVIGGFDNLSLAGILFVDGCSLLHFMKYVDFRNPEALNLKMHQLVYMWRDVLLLENQIPGDVLRLLRCNGCIDDLLTNFNAKGAPNQSPMLFPTPPFHVLDAHRSFWLYRVMEAKNKISKKPHGNECRLKFSFKNIKDLKLAGIRLRANNAGISFTSKLFGGVLGLPFMTIDEDSAYIFRNIIAYEMCRNVKYNLEWSTFIAFLDSLVDNAEDVMELRLAGVFQNLLGSDEEVAMLINDLAHDLPTKISLTRFCSDDFGFNNDLTLLKIQIEEHYQNKWKTGLALVRSKYFNTPWALVGVFAAVMGLVLSAVQTAFTVHPSPAPN